MRDWLKILCGKVLFTGFVLTATGVLAAPAQAEPTLQHLLDQEFGPGVLSADHGDLGSEAGALWQASSGASATLMFEYAGFASATVFGIYDSTSPDARLPLFYGFAEPLAESALSVIQLNSGGFRFSVTSGGITESAIFGSSVFGFYLRTPENNVFYSEIGLNSDATDHLRAFSLGGLTNQQGLAYGQGSYLLAWEDLLNGGDRDYNDLGVSVRGFMPAGSTPSPVPLPGALLLFGSGFAGLVGIGAGRRRRERAVA